MDEKREFRCLVCGGTIEPGFVQDRTYGAVLPAEWIAGSPVRSFWVGTKTDGVMHRQMEAFRCVDCGYVMLFARQVKA